MKHRVKTKRNIKIRVESQADFRTPCVIMALMEGSGSGGIITNEILEF